MQMLEILKERGDRVRGRKTLFWGELEFIILIDVLIFLYVLF